MHGTIHNLQHKWLVFAGFAALLLLGLALVFQHKWAVAKKPAALVGNWVGISDSDVFTYRMELESGGTGMFGFQFTNEKPDLYRVSWRLTGKRIAFDVQTTHASSELIALYGSVVGTHIMLRINGRDWKHRVEMWNEDKVLPRVLSLKNAIEAVRRETNTISGRPRPHHLQDQ